METYTRMKKLQSVISLNRIAWNRNLLIFLSLLLVSHRFAHLSLFERVQMEIEMEMNIHIRQIGIFLMKHWCYIEYARYVHSVFLFWSQLSKTKFQLNIPESGDQTHFTRKFPNKLIYLKQNTQDNNSPHTTISYLIFSRLFHLNHENYSASRDFDGCYMSVMNLIWISNQKQTDKKTGNLEHGKIF